VEGHRGIAAGSLKERQRKAEAGEQPYTKEEIEKWRNLPAGTVEGFVHNQELLHVHSSNVGALQYYPETQQLMVEYLGKKGKAPRSYLYDNVTQAEAIQFATVTSKGGAGVWDILRVRGSRTAHKKPYKRIR